MANQKKKKNGGRSSTSRSDKRESGSPGGGAGRRDQVGESGVYPASADNVPADADLRMAGSWGGGDYDEAGGSELSYRDGTILGGTTAGPDGEPTIDIHGASEPRAAQREPSTRNARNSKGRRGKS